MPPALTAALDAAAAAEPDKATRSDLIRRIVTDWLQARGFLQASPQPDLSDHQGQQRHQQAKADAKARKAAARRILEEDR